MKKLNIILISLIILLQVGCYTSMELHERAKQNFKEANIAEAIEDITSAIEKYHDEIKDANADNQMNKVGNIRKNLFNAYIFRGNIYLTKENERLSNKDYETSLNYYDIKNRDDAHNYVWILLEIGSGHRAVKAIEDNKRYFSNSFYERLLSIAYYEKKNFKSSETYFLRSIDSGFSHKQILINNHNNGIFRQKYTKKIQRKLCRHVDYVVQKGEKKILSQFNSPLDQYVYIKNRMATKLGKFGVPMSYLDAYENTYFSKMEIVVTKEEEECTKIWLLGTQCVTEVYAGKVFKDDMVIVNSSYLRTLHNSYDIATSGDNEAEGSYYAFKKDKGVDFNDMFTKSIPYSLAGEYVPTAYRSEYTNWKGGLLGFVEDHPIASLIIGAAAVKGYKWITTPTSSSSYNSSSSSTSSSSQAKKSCDAVKKACFSSCEGMAEGEYAMGGILYFRGDKDKCKSKCREISCD
ncbi:hypothetical protein GMMP1_120020 [Candidatus Magnetomoraceae bacterium gMMP-1]